MKCARIVSCRPAKRDDRCDTATDRRQHAFNEPARAGMLAIHLPKADMDARTPFGTEGASMPPMRRRIAPCGRSAPLPHAVPASGPNRTMVIAAKTLSEQAFEIIRERILTTELAPLTPIRQDALADELGISKIPLREALARLEQQGLLNSHPNRGFAVSALTSSEAEEVFELRLKLEPEAAANASIGASEAHRATVIALLADLEDAMKHQRDAIVRLNRQFHIALTQDPQRKVTALLIERLHLAAERYVHIHLEPQGHKDRADDEHREILSAWLARDAARVQALLTTHLQTTLDELRQELRDATP